jgi:ribosomal protein L3
MPYYTLSYQPVWVLKSRCNYMKNYQTQFARKIRMTECYLGDTRHAVTELELVEAEVLREKTAEKDGYISQVISFIKNPRQKTQKKATREVSSLITEIKPGQLLHVTATSKGKGFAGVMKRWGFAGGPRTHGQSDRARAPGSIGQGTTPGRVHKGKKMAGRMGGDSVNVRNLTVVAFDSAKNSLWVVGPVPGPKLALVTLHFTDIQKPLPEIQFLKGFTQ